MAKADNMLPMQDAEWAEALVGALEAFRTIDPDITASQVIALLLIAIEPGISQKALRGDKRLDLSSGSMARICAALSERGDRGKPGKGLVEFKESTKDLRSTLQVLSPRGRRLIGTVERIMREKET